VTAIDPSLWHKEQKKLQLLAQKSSSKKAGKTSSKKNIQLAKTDDAKASKQIYVQLGAFNEKPNAQALASRAQTFTQALSNVDVQVYPQKASNKGYYKVRIGPLADKALAQKLQKELLVLSKNTPPQVVIE